MASPSFVYAFDNLGPDKFVELCGLLLGSRYKGFLLSAPGPDGGIDGENDQILGQLRVENNSLLVDTILPKNGVVVFQFKHMVVARVGESQSRNKLLQKFVTTKGSISEVNKPTILETKPNAYILVTNVEVNSNFRKKFIETCERENDNIEHYQIVGLDEIENWVVEDRNLRSQYFPTIFGKPRFNLKLRLDSAWTFDVLNLQNVYQGGSSELERKEEILSLFVMNIGESTSYLSCIKFKILIDGKIQYCMRSPLPKGADPLHNPSFDEPIEPGRCKIFNFPMAMFREEFKSPNNCFLSEVIVFDQIDNKYTLEISDEIRETIFQRK